MEADGSLNAPLCMKMGGMVGHPHHALLAAPRGDLSPVAPCFTRSASFQSFRDLPCFTAMLNLWQVKQHYRSWHGGGVEGRLY